MPTCLRTCMFTLTLCAWSVLLLSGCSSGGSESFGSGGNERVHAPAWSNPADLNAATFHGQVAASQGTATCTACHGADLEGAGTIPGCRSCHFTSSGGRVPPGVNWSHGSVPHSSLLAYGDTCNGCHETYRANGLGPNSCHDCHGGAGHSLGQPWLDPASSTFHGSEAVSDLESCRQCHGQDLSGGIAQVGCSECHFGPAGDRVPTGSDWSHGSVPHGQLATQAGICNGCHDLLRSYGEGPAACHDCHVTVSHPLGPAWLDSASATFHGAAASADLDSCRSCHGSSLDGGIAGVSCDVCHFGPDGSRVPSGVNWVHGTSHAPLAAYEAVCTQCHTLTRQFRGQPGSCHDCHGSGASHPLGQPWLDKSAAGWHGAVAAQGSAACQPCHGNDLRGGSSGVSCFICHFTATGSRVPPGVNWVHGFSSHFGLGSYQNVCTACHNTNRAYGHSPSACHDCHGDGD